MKQVIILVSAIALAVTACGGDEGKENAKQYISGNCVALAKQGISNVKAGDRNYTRTRDRDRDGVACESNE